MCLAAVGDCVIAHIGYALQKLDREEAERTLQLFAEPGQMRDVQAGLGPDPV